MNNNNNLHSDLDLLGRHDDLELTEFGETDAEAGGWWTTWGCGTIVVTISTAFCPTTKCTKYCR